MTRARQQLISPQDTPYYHCTTRCVRRAYLCGEDPLTGKNFDHRRQWIVDKLTELKIAFCIDICAYAVMSNHYHLVLFINESTAAQLTCHQVVERWHQLFSGTQISKRYLSGESLSAGERVRLDRLTALWRSRLADISWFMRCLNEDIARRANREDRCKGHFWEKRFDSQALLDEPALLTAMAYSDLNPIRACTADCPENSDYTSIQTRIHQISPVSAEKLPAKHPKLKQLDSSYLEAESDKAIHFDFFDYLELVDFTGRVIRDDKRGYIQAHLAPILARINIDAKKWFELMQPKQIHRTRVLGCPEKLAEYAKAHQLSYIRGSPLASELYLH